MSVAILPPPVSEAEPKRKRWTRTEYWELEAKGAWVGQKLELIDGELLDKMGKNWPHCAASGLLINWLAATFGRRVLAEASIDLTPADQESNEPEPDVVVLKRPIAELGRKPGGSDIALLIEVSDSSLCFDLTTKLALYACWDSGILGGRPWRSPSDRASQAGRQRIWFRAGLRRPRIGEPALRAGRVARS